MYCFNRKFPSSGKVKLISLYQILRKLSIEITVGYIGWWYHQESTMFSIHGFHIDWKTCKNRWTFSSQGKVSNFENSEKKVRNFCTKYWKNQVIRDNMILFVLNWIVFKWNGTFKRYWEMEKNQEKIREISQSENVGTMISNLILGFPENI